MIKRCLQDAFGMEFIIKRLSEYYHNWGLTISMSKIEYMAVNSSTNFKISISNEQVEGKRIIQVSMCMGY